jgi:hypothetical protein
VLTRRLVGRHPFWDLLGVKGRKWLRSWRGVRGDPGVHAPHEFLEADIARIERKIAQHALYCLTRATCSQWLRST